MKEVFKLVIMLWCVCLAFSPPARAEGSYMQATGDAALVWNSYASKTRTIQWNGEVDSGGYAFGKGVVLFFNDGSLSAAYMGMMRQGRMEGHVIAVYPSAGMCYLGRIKNWNEEGQGRMVYCDGSYYLGEWRNSERSGRGVQFGRDGRILYEGEFTGGRPTDGTRLPAAKVSLRPSGGLRKKYQSSNLAWYGDLDERGIARGVGVMVSRNSEGQVVGIYHGTTYDGRMDSNVLALYVRARRAYTGGLVDGSENGFGRMLYPDGSYYVGNWKDEKKHGFGELHDATGALSLQGIYENDLFIQEASRVPANSVAGPAGGESENRDARASVLDDSNQRARQAVRNILQILMIQKGVDVVTDADNEEWGALVSLISKSFYRAPAIDENLGVLYPDTPLYVRQFYRNVLCALCDGTLTVDNLLERTAKSTAMNAAGEMGADEQMKMRIGILALDFSRKVEKIQSKRSDPDE